MDLKELKDRLRALEERNKADINTTDDEKYKIYLRGWIAGLNEAVVYITEFEREQKANNEPQALPMFDVSGSLAYQKSC